MGARWRRAGRQRLRHADDRAGLSFRQRHAQRHGRRQHRNLSNRRATVQPVRRLRQRRLRRHRGRRRRDRRGSENGQWLVDAHGTNTYSGGTTINGGIFVAPINGAPPGYNVVGEIVVQNGGTVAVDLGSGKWTAADIPRCSTMPFSTPARHWAWTPATATSPMTMPLAAISVCQSSARTRYCLPRQTRIVAIR